MKTRTSIIGIIGLALVIISQAASLPAFKTKPWKGQRQTIPGKITAALYDEGGEGVAFHDTDAKNNGSGSLNRGPAEKNNFRKDEAVDISYTKPAFDKFTDGTALEADQYYVGWIAPEEWVNYSVDVKTAGTYQIHMLSTAAKEATEISLSVDGVDKTGAIVLKTTGHVHTWRMYTNLAEMKLEQGPHVLTLKFVKEGLMNVQHLEFVPKPPGATPNFDSKPTATGHDRRIDVVWEQSDTPGANTWNIWRASEASGPFERLNARPQHHTVCSDFLGSNGATFFYRVSGVSGGNEISTSAVVSASSGAMTDDELLSSVQEATFRYFWHHGHPTSGLAREGSEDTDRVTTGGSGFGVMAILVGAERGFVSRSAAAARILKMLVFLEDKASRYHGAWAHWLNGQTGQTISFSRFDDGGDLVETSFLVEGLLTARQYFKGGDPTEQEIRRRATKLWEAVEWDWYLGEPKGEQLFWHWSPNHGWKMNHRIGGHFNECLITYLLALASPTHPIPASCYTNGWIGKDPAKFVNGNPYFGIPQPVGWPMGGPLFFTHYSFLGFDPRPWSDPHCNYFENNRAISRIHHAYAVTNPGNHTGYGENVWGLTASRGPDGYKAFQPRNDNGTVAPTAALSAMPYTPRESMTALKHYYHTLGHRLWGNFGFKDAFNLDRNWFERSYLAIDQGPIVVMIENHRSGLCWRLFMANDEIPRALSASGWTKQ